MSLLGAVVLVVGSGGAQEEDSTTVTTKVTCSSADGVRQHCTANTSAGILMTRTIGSAACLSGKTWGYDDAGVWVLDGCSAEFIVMGAKGGAPLAASETVLAETETPALAEAKVKTEESDTGKTKETVDPANDTWGMLDSGKGFLLGKGEYGEASLSAYALVRYLDQRDDDGVFTEPVDRERPVDGLQDIYSHRVLVWLNGWVADPKLRYTITWWTVTETDQDALFGNIGYQCCFPRSSSMDGACRSAQKKPAFSMYHRK